MDWLHVESWLKTIYTDQSSVPSFEHTKENYEMLNKLKELNYIDSPEVIEYILYQNSKIMVDDIKLSESGQLALKSLALLAESLGMGATDLSNYYTAISRLSMDQMEMSNELTTLNDIEYKLNECQKSANDELVSVKGILTKLQNNSSNSNLHQEASNQTLNELTSNYLSLEKKYNDMDIEKNGTRLSQVHELEAKVIATEKLYKEKYETLETYQDLPPDMALASFKIQKTKDQLHELEQERESLISDIAKSVY